MKQLGELAERDLLTSWMAEYLGEKISEVKRARGRQREALEKECAGLILKLWDRRHQLPNGTRPLESFEPIFVVLNELSPDKPRYSLLRNLPPFDKNSKAGTIIQGVLAIDQSASVLIRYLLAEAVETIAKSDKRWANIRTASKTTPWDIRIVRILIEDAETMADRKQALKKAQREKLQGMLESLENLDKCRPRLRALLEEKLKAAE